MYDNKHNFFDGNGLVPAHRHPNGGGWVADTAIVCNDVYIGANTEVTGTTKILNKIAVMNAVTITKCPITVYGLLWPVSITDNHISIGCEFHPIHEWENFDHKVISDMDPKAYDFWAEHRTTILGLANIHQRSIITR